MVMRSILFLMAVTLSSCSHLPDPKVSVCLLAQGNANLDPVSLTPLPTYISILTSPKKDNLLEFDFNEYLKLEKESRNTFVLYPGEYKCIEIRHKYQEKYIGVYAAFNNQSDSISNIIDLIPIRLLDRNIKLKIDNNKILKDI